MPVVGRKGFGTTLNFYSEKSIIQTSFFLLKIYFYVDHSQKYTIKMLCCEIFISCYLFGNTADFKPCKLKNIKLLLETNQNFQSDFTVADQLWLRTHQISFCLWFTVNSYLTVIDHYEDDPKFRTVVRTD